jgi:hypothetical protein
MVVFYSSIVTYSWLSPTHGSWLSPTHGCHLLVVVNYHTVHVVFMQKEPYNNKYCHTFNLVIHHTRRTTLHTAILLIRNSLHTQDTDNYIVKYDHTVHVVFK